MPRRPTLTDALTSAAIAFADAIHGHRDTQLHRIETTLTRLEDRMTALDKSVDALVDAITVEVQDLKDKLAQAQADDATAAELAASVESTIGRIDALTAGARDGSFPAAPGAGTIDTGTTTDGTVPATDDGTSGPLVDGQPVA